MLVWERRNEKEREARARCIIGEVSLIIVVPKTFLNGGLPVYIRLID